MAKQVKVFDVTVGATATTVYTVPAGRVAKVIVTRYTSNTAFNVGGYMYGISYGPVRDAAQQANDWLILCSERRFIKGDGFHSPFVFEWVTLSLIRTHYLSAGQAVVLQSGFAQFCVIEEF